MGSIVKLIMAWTNVYSIMEPIRISDLQIGRVKDFEAGGTQFWTKYLGGEEGLLKFETKI